MSLEKIFKCDKCGKVICGNLLTLDVESTYNGKHVSHGDGTYRTESNLSFWFSGNKHQFHLCKKCFIKIFKSTGLINGVK